jgi:hypothetical protein
MLKVGLVGLPNAGKSTLFNALVKGSQADVGNFPFCTIDPNIGLVEVPDDRLAQLAAIVKPGRIVPAAIEFVDIAGLVAGAHEGQGLGNKFLSHIREVDAIALVLRAFPDGNVIHVDGSVDPVRDYETLMLELVLADLQVVSKIYDGAERLARGGKPDDVARAKCLAEIKTALDANRPVSDIMRVEVSESMRQTLREIQLLSAKPRLIVLNVDDHQAAQADVTVSEILERGRTVSDDFAPAKVMAVSARIESELNALDPDEQTMFLAEYGLTEPGLNRVVRQSYGLLQRQSFFTAGPMEVRAWTIPIGATAPQAAGVIHTDFEERFIRAEVVAFDDFIKYDGEAKAREAGRLRSEGKDYVVQDGDVMHIRFAPK